MITKFSFLILAVAFFISCDDNTFDEIIPAQHIHAVTNLAHEFTFYADHRFHIQYLPGHKGVTNWCNLYNFDFSNANLLILLGCDDRIEYVEKDLAVINNFLYAGGGVVVFGRENTKSQNALLNKFGAEFTAPATEPLTPSKRLTQEFVEGSPGSSLTFDRPKEWDVLIYDGNQTAVLARKKVGNGTLLVSSRTLAGSNPNASDSINKLMWRTLLPEIAAGKEVNPHRIFNGAGIDRLEYNDDHNTFMLSYNDYLKPYAGAMADIYQKSLPHIESRMGVPLSEGMGSQITLLATGGGGFSSGAVIGLGVWWGGFPEREDSMIELLTHEAVHSWVLPFPEVWNEPIATYVGNLVMIDMGHEEEAKRRIENTIERASKLDPDMNNYDINGNLTGTGRELNNHEKNEMHWGKTYWIFEELRKENTEFLADYFKLKRQYATPEAITQYDMNNTVALLSMAMGRDLFDWFNKYGMPVDSSKAEIEVAL